MKIEKVPRGGMATVRLIGHFQSEHVGELQKQLLESRTPFVLDLKELTIVDVDVVRFLGACESKGMKILHCSRYICEWILRERQSDG